MRNVKSPAQTPEAEAIKAGIKRPIAARDHAPGRPAPAAIPRQMD
jgi:hypothetical protein